MVIHKIMLFSGFFIALHALDISAHAGNFTRENQECEQNTNNESNKSPNNYEFIASKLGILGKQSMGISPVLSKIITSLKQTCMIGAYLGTVFYVKEENIELIGNETFDKLTFGFIAAFLTDLMLSTCAEYLDTPSQKVVYFYDVVENWPLYKDQTPQEYHLLFDELYRQFVQEKNTLGVSEDFINEVFKRVATAYVDSLAAQS